MKVNLLKEEDITPDKLKQFQFIILSEQFKEKINLNGYSVEECGYSYGGQFKVRSLWSIRKIDELRTLLSELQQRYYLLIKSALPPH